ncbi:MAG: hypothetical protein U9N08_05250 [Candidatus Caldatribacteriota bacterium]|nr:hypothetical protein [Candidatus Caldatribacteriota bacterium]
MLISCPVKLVVSEQSPFLSPVGQASRMSIGNQNSEKRSQNEEQREEDREEILFFGFNSSLLIVLMERKDKKWLQVSTKK